MEAAAERVGGQCSSLHQSVTGFDSQTSRAPWKLRKILKRSRKHIPCESTWIYAVHVTGEKTWICDMNRYYTYIYIYIFCIYMKIIYPQNRWFSASKWLGEWHNYECLNFSATQLVSHSGNWANTARHRYRAPRQKRGSKRTRRTLKDPRRDWTARSPRWRCNLTAVLHSASLRRIWGVTTILTHSHMQLKLSLYASPDGIIETLQIVICIS